MVGHMILLQRDFKRNVCINQELIPLKSPTFSPLRGNSDDYRIRYQVYMVAVDNKLIFKKTVVFKIMVCIKGVFYIGSVLMNAIFN
jgi:hypothetical protein